MKTKRLNILFLITLLSGALAIDNNSEALPGITLQHEVMGEVPFIFSFFDNANPAMNPFAERATNFHLTIISGRVGSVLGLQIGGLVNFVKYDFTGYDATGISSTIEGNFSGFQTTGIYNRVAGSFVGIQDVGIYNFVGSDFTGIQTAGIINQVDGMFNGIQIAGISNTVKQPFSGMQIAGIVNNAGQVKGMQIGLVNRSKKLDGIAIGLVNISETGSVHGTAWSGGAMDLNAGLKFAPNHYWYTILSLGRGSNFADNEDEDETSFGYYMGFRLPVPIVPSLFAELDIGNNSIFAGDLFDDSEWEDKASMAFETRASLVFRIHKRLSFVAGVVQTRIGDDFSQFSENETEYSQFFGIQF